MKRPTQNLLWIWVLQSNIGVDNSDSLLIALIQKTLLRFESGNGN
jgi:hypothetical protein